MYIFIIKAKKRKALNNSLIDAEKKCIYLLYL